MDSEKYNITEQRNTNTKFTEFNGKNTALEVEKIKKKMTNKQMQKVLRI